MAQRSVQTIVDQIVQNMRSGYSSQVQLARLTQPEKQTIKKSIEEKLSSRQLKDRILRKDYERILYTLYSKQNLNTKNMWRKLSYLFNIPKGSSITQDNNMQITDPNKKTIIIKILRQMTRPKILPPKKSGILDFDNTKYLYFSGVHNSNLIIKKSTSSTNHYDLFLNINKDVPIGLLRKIYRQVVDYNKQKIQEKSR